MAGDGPEDEGLADERTDLAWNRSGLAFAVCAAVLLRRTWPLRGADQFVALGSVSAGAAAWALALTIGRVRRGTVSRSRPRLGPRRATAITVSTLALALAAVTLTFLTAS
ncbi:MAG TPA: DUF202 domain-containing protein [Acidimicrobiales bacterium]|nr:DUF202 domain-containing protein [Acidimicrobiales bacterium]